MKFEVSTNMVMDGMEVTCCSGSPVGTWTTSTTGFPPISGNTGGGTGTTIGKIGGSSTPVYNYVAMSGRYSEVMSLTLDAGYEMRFTLTRGGSWAGEIALQIQEAKR